ncbi:hypothetical protein J6590_038051 [Homalodisca vitripennis]|nr:hypothetical protein J6590_038051 [Homalodisca vitripennis]
MAVNFRKLNDIALKDDKVFFVASTRWTVPKNPLCEICGKETTVTVKGANMIVNGRMNCPDLLAEIDLRVPANTRSRDLLGRRYRSTNFDFNSPFVRFIRLGNQFASGCDLFAGRPSLFFLDKQGMDANLTRLQRSSLTNERTHTNEGLLNSPELHQLIDIHIPQKTRLTQTFSRHHYHTVYAYHSTVPRLMRLRNGSQLEFFGMTHQTFRRQALSLPSEDVFFRHNQCGTEAVDAAHDGGLRQTETRRRQQVEAAERRQREQENRGIKNPERVKKMQLRSEELDKLEMQANRTNQEGGLKWQVS